MDADDRHAEPTVLLKHGCMIHGALRGQRVSEAQVRQAVRGSGCGALEDIALVLLETDGTLSVISAERVGSGTAIGCRHLPLCHTRRAATASAPSLIAAAYALPARRTASSGSTSPLSTSASESGW